MTKFYCHVQYQAYKDAFYTVEVDTSVHNKDKVITALEQDDFGHYDWDATHVTVDE